MRSRIVPEVELIRAVCRKFVYNYLDNTEIKSLLRKEEIDWHFLRRLLGYHEIYPFFYLIIKDYKEEIPDSIFQSLSYSYYYTISMTLKKYKEYQIIDTIFKEYNIQALPIKGMALLHDIYSGLFIRPMVDIDMLVKKEDLMKAVDILHKLGYKKELLSLKESYWLEKQCHLEFFRNNDNGRPPDIVELHFLLDFKRNGIEILPNLWDRCREIEADKRNVKLLSIEDTIFSLALHNRRFGKTLCIKNIIDIGLLLNRYRNNIDWEYLLREARDGRMKTSLFFILSQARFLLDMKNLPHFCRNLNIPFYTRRLINRFIEKNTFSFSGNNSSKSLYLKSHFLFYDSFWEPIEYILNIPQEQFAKFYDLKAYDKRTNFLYRNRFLYVPIKFLISQ